MFVKTLFCNNSLSTKNIRNYFVIFLSKKKKKLFRHIYSLFFQNFFKNMMFAKKFKFRLRPLETYARH